MNLKHVVAKTLNWHVAKPARVLCLMVVTWGGEIAFVTFGVCQYKSPLMATRSEALLL